MRRIRLPIASAVVAALALIAALVDAIGLLAAQEKGRSIWDGVYTAAQAERGRNVALSVGSTPCIGCHGPDLAGGARDNAPPLKGEAFMTQWENGSVNRLFTKIRDSMPPPNLGALPIESKLDVLAYLLQVNGFPAGSTELRDAGELENILIIRRDAETAAAANFALVQVVGCLQPRSNGWVLTNTTEPVVTKEDMPAPAAAKSAETQALGAQVFELVSVSPSFQPESHKGHKMDARGFLHRVPNRNRLSLTSLQMVASACPN